MTNQNSLSTKALIILDGWGHSNSSASNAIETANTPVWDKLLQDYPHSLLGTSGADVGLPDGQMGNSEVGHMNIGAGRVVYQNLTRISKAIDDGDFFTNSTLTQTIDDTIAHQGKVHICGLLSDGGVHCHMDHIIAACKMAYERGAQSIVLHGWLDGRDTPPRSAANFIHQVIEQIQPYNVTFGTIAGRYYAMDRDNRWTRTQTTYQAMRYGQAEYFYNDPIAALEAAYARDENDEFVTPTTILNNADTVSTIEDNDCVICMNFRPDRSRQITQAFAEPNFANFPISSPLNLTRFLMLTEYSADLSNHCACAFPPESINNDIGDVVAQAGLQQLRIAETEKYAHVTFFFSGGKESEYAGETRMLIPSPDVATYDLQPEMSAIEVTEKLVAAITSKQFALIVCNFANADMVGHTGKFDAAVKAVEAIDQCLGRILAAINKTNGEAFITADHGNVELMIDPDTNQPHTAHTKWPVPFVYVCDTAKQNRCCLSSGVLADIAPTLLDTMGIEKPAQMTGNSLIFHV